MAMAHPLPTLGTNKVSRHQQLMRASSAPPDIRRLREMLRPMDPKEIAMIKENARNDWREELERNSRSATTYSGLHARKILDQPTQYRVRPCSPTRLNKPHPPNVFLVTRLKHIKGCYEPSQGAKNGYGGTGQQRLNEYIEKNKEKIHKAMGHQPPPQRPRTAEIYSKRTKMATVMGEVPGQATEAWMKLSNDQDRKLLLNSIDEASKRHKDIRNQQREIANRRKQHPSLRRRVRAIPTTYKPELIMSSNRWMKKAGREETDAVERLIEAFRKAPQREIPNEGPHFHITDYSSMFASVPKPPYYDFQIHPEWHMPWHKQYDKRIAASSL